MLLSSRSRFSELHERLILRHPVATLLVMALLTAFFAWHARDFGLDASADSLTLERDEDLGYYRLIRARYGSDDFLIVTFEPEEDLFSDEVLADLADLRSDLAAVDNVDSVTTILDVPLIKSPPADLRQLSSGLRRLEDAATDRNLAKQELIDSALYRDLLISADGRTTALRVDFEQDERYVEVRELRNRLREKEYESGLSTD